MTPGTHIPVVASILAVCYDPLVTGQHPLPAHGNDGPATQLIWAIPGGKHDGSGGPTR